MEIREINLRAGVGDLNFAMAEHDIITHLGEPNDIDNDTLNNCLVYYYDELGLAIVFVEIDTQLVIESFEMENDAYRLWDTVLFNQPFDKMIELFKQHNISDFESTNDDYAAFMIYQNLFINFDSNTNKVTDFCLSNPDL